MVIDRNGHLVGSFTNSLIDGPWGMTVNDKVSFVQLFVSNALSGNITRLDLSVTSTSLTVIKALTISSGYMHRCDPAALVVAPTGLVFEPEGGRLFIASTEDNAVFVVPGASDSASDRGKGTLVYSDSTHLHGALAMALAPNGDLLVTNSDVINADPAQPSEIVEFTTLGQFVKEIAVDPNLGGSFGLQVGPGPSPGTARLAAADDNTATLMIWTIPVS